MVNNAGCYVGEVIRKTAGRGRWWLDKDEHSLFHGYPLIVDFRDNDTASPLSVVTACTDRRRGITCFRWQAI